MTAPTPGAAPSKVFPLFPALALISIKKKKNIKDKMAQDVKTAMGEWRDQAS